MQSGAGIELPLSSPRRSSRSKRARRLTLPAGHSFFFKKKNTTTSVIAALSITTSLFSFLDEKQQKGSVYRTASIVSL
jgi:hypothetical protein